MFRLAGGSRVSRIRRQGWTEDVGKHETSWLVGTNASFSNEDFWTPGLIREGQFTNLLFYWTSSNQAQENSPFKEAELGLEYRIPGQCPPFKRCRLLWAKARANSCWLGGFCLGKGQAGILCFQCFSPAQVPLAPETAGLQSCGSQGLLHIRIMGGLKKSSKPRPYQPRLMKSMSLRVRCRRQDFLKTSQAAPMFSATFYSRSTSQSLRVNLLGLLLQMQILFQQVQSGA